MDFAPVLDYINDYWPRIIRYSPTEQSTLIGLPRPYLVPAEPTGNAMFQEMYYWDSYFMALGLVGTAHESLIVDMCENMAYLFERFGIIPNGSRYYFLSRSQPPFFVELIWLAHAVVERQGGDARAFLSRMMTLAEREHETVWQGSTQPHHRLVYRGLSRYFDINYLHILASCESGWDHSTRCEHRWLDHLPIDLNAILFSREQRFAEAAHLLGNHDHAVRWEQAAADRAATMRELMWDESDGLFYDYDYIHERRTRHPSLAAFFPLWAGLATQEQADRLVHDWLPRFEQPGGLVTSLSAETGMQWAYPNGWAPLQWIAVAGLERYGYGDYARRLRRAWCDNCVAVFARTGALWEKYNVVEIDGSLEEGLYGSIRGFGWSNAVFADFARQLV